MELVYIWVEEYKNIKRQGFNFSSRYNCEFKYKYDENNELKKDCELIIHENEDYISIFPKDINVTGIIGTNGSGKSNILEIISIYSELITELNLRPFSEREVNLKIGNSFFVFYLNNKFVKNFGIDCKLILNKKKIKYESSFVREHFTLIYNFMLENRHEPFYYNFDKSNKLFVQPNKSDNNIDFEFQDNQSNKFLLFNILEFDKEIHIINDFFIPYYFKLEINKKLYFDLKKLDKKLFNKLFGFQNKVTKIRNKITLSLNDIKLLNSIFYVLDIDDRRKYPMQQQYKISKEYSNILKKDNFKEKIKFLFNHNYDEIFDEEIKYIQKDFNFIKFLENNYICGIHNSRYIFNKDIELLCALPNWIEIKLYNEKNVSFNDLSNGERIFIRLVYNLIFYLLKIKKENFSLINILFDEVELGLHPQWQKKLLNLILNILKNYPIPLNIVFTSHSPFILSDLPKENVILLEKNQETGNCINVTDKMKDFNTFGANIHTLLSHGFFMKDDGLMGEFAKDKINQVYNFISRKDTSFIKTKEEAQNIINLIGEPMLKKELQFLYDKEFEIDDIDKQIREHEEAIEKLKSKKKKND